MGLVAPRIELGRTLIPPGEATNLSQGADSPTAATTTIKRRAREQSSLPTTYPLLALLMLALLALLVASSSAGILVRGCMTRRYPLAVDTNFIILILLI